MQLTVNQQVDLNAALSSLDGYQRVIKDEATKTEKVVFVPYSFSGKTRWNLGKAITITKRAADDLNKVKDDLIREISGGDRIAPEDHASVTAFNLKWIEVLQTQEEVPILSLTLDELNLDVNPIPSSVLSVLSLIVKES